jgi:hypothetical protein
MTPTRTLFLLAIRDYPQNQNAAAFAAGVDAQFDVVRTLWCAPYLGERALAEHHLGAIKTRRDLDNVVHHAGLRALGADDRSVSRSNGRDASLPDASDGRWVTRSPSSRISGGTRVITAAWIRSSIRPTCCLTSSAAWMRSTDSPEVSA